MDRIGSVYYALGRYGEALAVWTQALPFERNLTKRRALQNSINVTRRSLGLADENFNAAASTAAAATHAPVFVLLAPANKTLSPETKAAIRALYKTGVKYYATGQYLQATTAFLRILDMDPGNADATKALQRLKLDR
jgi:tetratricopeptide (TPR) repeat protein